MAWYDAFTDILIRDRRLEDLTTLRIGGPARYFFTPENIQVLADLLAVLQNQGIPAWYLGRGSNLLIDDQGVDGAVVSLGTLEEIPEKKIPEKVGELVVAAGVFLPALVKKTIDMGLKGLEGCVGIPGSVGGALHQNAGGARGSFGDVVVSATVVTPQGEVETRPVSDLGLGYRTSSLGGGAVVSVRIRLEKDDPQAIRSRANSILEYRKATQPLQDHTPGCIFMNPPGGKSAGRLLDDAGMKGQRRGRACISEKHANFVVNMGGAKACEVRDLIREARDRVLNLFGVSLTQEIEDWPQRAAVVSRT